MIRNYFKIAWRNLMKHKVFSIINITGLSIGVSACLLISLFITHELSYDKDVPDSENIYRLLHYFNIDGSTEWGAHHSALMASTIEMEFDEVIRAGRIMDNPLQYGAGSNEVSFHDEPLQYHEEGFAYADQQILDIFELPFIHGNRVTALAEPRTIVISESKAKKYFENENPVGKTLYLNGRQNEAYTISGVYRDFPENSNLNYDFLLTLKGVEFEPGEQTRWTQRNYLNFLQLKPQTNLKQFEKRLTTVIFDNHLLPAYRDAGRGKTSDVLRQSSSMELQPLKDIHLYSGEIEDGHNHGDIRFVWIFGAIALFILILACINFINLSTAMSANRAKEVGLRKVIGSSRNDLVFQFLSESVLLAVIAFCFGLLLADIFLPYFNNIANKALAIPYDSAQFFFTLLIAAVSVGLIAGIYPSFYLSGFNPINVLKGRISMGSKSSGIRSGLVIFQFTISIVLIAGTLVIQDQMNFILNKKIGFDKDQVIQIQGVNILGDRQDFFKEELAQISGVQQVSNSDYLPIEGTKRNSNPFYRRGKNNEMGVQAQVWGVDEDYIETLGIKLLEGRNFRSDGSKDEDAVIINEALAKEIGIPDPVGKEIFRGEQSLRIIGVVENFHFESLKEKVGPVALLNSDFNSTITSVKINTADVPGLISSLERKWKEFAPNLDFRYSFMDASYARMYRDVERMGQIFIAFALLAILVACLGLFALSSFMVEQRRKEMSVRKVLGASGNTIFHLLTRYFLSLVLISLVIAIPVSYYMMSQWLQDYAYRIDISWQVFALSGGLALFIALATVSYHAWKAAMVNPATILRSE